MMVVFVVLVLVDMVDEFMAVGVVMVRADDEHHADGGDRSW